jgi:hypothetical protein
VVLHHSDDVSAGIRHFGSLYGKLIAEKRPELTPDEVEFNALHFSQEVAIRAKALIAHAGSIPEGSA